MYPIIVTLSRFLENLGDFFLEEMYNIPDLMFNQENIYKLKVLCENSLCGFLFHVVEKQFFLFKKRSVGIDILEI